MKFTISRASVIDDKICPIEGASRENIIRVDKRIVRTLDEARDAHWARTFFHRDNRNFREENGCVKADYDTKAWTIEIQTLDELLKLANTEEDLIISPIGNWISKDYPHIEIHDEQQY